MAAAAWATASSFAVMAISLLIFVQRVYPVPYDWGKVFSLVAGAASLFFLWKFIPSLQTWWIELIMLGVYSLATLLVTGGRKSLQVMDGSKVDY